jgi:hypothetical protein
MVQHPRVVFDKPPQFLLEVTAYSLEVDNIFMDLNDLFLGAFN